MILKTKPNKNIYGKYFLAVEAPDDEETEVTEEQPKPRRNVKVISVKPSNRGKDFTQVGNDPITPDNAEVDDSIDIDETDYNADNTADEPAETTEDQPTETEAEPTQAEETQPEVQAEHDPNAETQEPVEDQPATDETTDFNNTGDEPAAEETGEDAPVTDDGQDFTSTDDGTQQDAVDPNATTTTTDTTKPGVEFDSTRKYNLYKEFMSLYNATDNYISKLENILRNDNDENQIIRISVNNLREIKDILFDYMTIRFQLNTYVQSLLFYQKMIVSVQLVFKLLKSINTLKGK